MPDEPITQTTTEPAPTTETSAESGPDFSPLMERFDEFGERIGRIEQAVAQEPEPEAQPFPDLQQLYGGDGQPQYDEYGNPAGEPPVDSAAHQQALDPRALQGFVQKAVDSALQPHLEAQAEQRRVEEAMALEEQYPELREKENVQRVVGQAQQFAAQVATTLRLPEDAAERIAREPSFIELIYKAEKADLSAARETPAGTEQGVDLEAGGGRQPGPEEDDAGQRMVQAASSNNFWTG